MWSCHRRSARRPDSSLTNYDIYCSYDLEQALDSIFYHPNVGPFICRQLIQRLVMSNPSRDYVYRVTQVFNDDGTGTRGNMQAVVKAILLDYEARSPDLLSEPTYGKQREPLLKITGVARALPSPAANGGIYAESGTQTITITDHQRIPAEQRRHHRPDIHGYFGQCGATKWQLHRAEQPRGHQWVHGERDEFGNGNLYPEQRHHYRQHQRSWAVAGECLLSGIYDRWRG